MGLCRRTFLKGCAATLGAAGFWSVMGRRAFAVPGEIAHTRIGEYMVLTAGDTEGPANGEALLTGLSRKQRAAHMRSGQVRSQVHVFVILMPECTLLVDTGFGIRTSALAALLDAGLAPDRVDMILLTHMHGDHISGALRDGEPTYPKAQIWLAEEEAAYWTSDEAMRALPEEKQGAFALPRAVLGAYGERVRTFSPDQAIVPGVTAVPLHGHTPGHSGFLLESQGERLLFWGDVIHFAEVQFPVPTATVIYDADQGRAAATRLALLKRLAAERVPFAGAHLPFPGMGTVAEKNGAFVFEPKLNFYSKQ